MTPRAPLRPAVRAIRSLRAWPVTAQQQARRNAMIALTECTRRRVEREDVEQYLAQRVALGTAPGAAPLTAPAVSLHA